MLLSQRSLRMPCGDNAWSTDFTNDKKVSVADILAVVKKAGTI